MQYLKTAILVLVLLVIGYLLLPYVKIAPKNPAPKQNNSDQQSQNSQGQIVTFTSDDLGISFKYNNDQDGDGKADTTAKQAQDKVYVYYTASPMEQGQWVQEFKKSPSDSLTTAIQKQFLTSYSSKDCFAQTLQDYYASYGVATPTIPAGVSEAVIAYPKTTDPNAPYWQNASKCPQTYTVSNGISYFYMDQNHPDKFFFFSIGQYGIMADMTRQQTWQETFQVNK